MSRLPRREKAKFDLLSCFRAGGAELCSVHLDYGTLYLKLNLLWKGTPERTKLDSPMAISFNSERTSLCALANYHSSIFSPLYCKKQSATQKEVKARKDPLLTSPPCFALHCGIAPSHDEDPSQLSEPLAYSNLASSSILFFSSNDRSNTSKAATPPPQ
jgi:hypothetical protein